MSTWRFTMPTVLLGSLLFACSTPIPDDQIQAKVSSSSHPAGADKKATAPKKAKPPTGTATSPTTPNTSPTNTTPTTGDATPTTPSPPATTDPPPVTTTPPAGDPPPVTTPPPAADPPPATTQNLVEVDCCIGTQFIACAAPSGTQCADVNVSTDCQTDPTFDDLCL